MRLRRRIRVVDVDVDDDELFFKEAPLLLLLLPSDGPGPGPFSWLACPASTTLPGCLAAEVEEAETKEEADAGKDEEDGSISPLSRGTASAYLYLSYITGLLM